MALLSPVFNIPQFLDENSNPLAGGKIWAYDAGSFEILKATYNSEDGFTANTNPIVLNSAGQLTTAIWLTPAEAYNLVLTKSDGTTVIKNFDDIFGIPVSSTGGGGGTTTIWQPTVGATYLTTNSFSVSGNETANFQIGNRARLSISGGYVYGTVSAISFSTPNTYVTLAMDSGATLNSSLSLAEWSLLIAPGRTVDANGVSYVTSITPTAGTVASALSTHTTDIATTNTRIDALRRVWPTTGTNTLTISPSPAITSYTADQVFTVKFSNAATGATTININGVGAVPIKQYNSSGTGIDPTITAGQISDLAYSGTQFILLDPLPAATTTIPHGMTVFLTNGTYTVPAGVYSIKVTAVGGGGGGGGNFSVGFDGPTLYGGGGGGAGATVESIISTTPGTSYSVGVGIGGAGGTETVPGAGGGSSSFGITVVIAAGGGGGGSGFTVVTGGAGGNAGSSGTLVLPGGSGGPGGGAGPGAGGVGAQGYYSSGGIGQYVGAAGNGGQGLVKVEY